MCPAEAPVTALTNRRTVEIIQRLQRLEALQTGVAGLITKHSPVPRQNAQLRLLCSELAKLLARASDTVHPKLAIKPWFCRWLPA
jgi:hypothetical protein